MVRHLAGHWYIDFVSSCKNDDRRHISYARLSKFQIEIGPFSTREMPCAFCGANDRERLANANFAFPFDYFEPILLHPHEPRIINSVGSTIFRESGLCVA